MSLGLDRISAESIPIAVEVSDPPSLVYYTPKKHRNIVKGPRSALVGGCGGCACGQCSSTCVGGCCVAHAKSSQEPLSDEDVAMMY